MKKIYFIGLLLTLAVFQLFAQTPDNLWVSGITNPVAANGQYQKQLGTHGFFNHEYWKHETENYYLFSDKLDPLGFNENYWNLDADLDDENSNYITFSTTSPGGNGIFNDVLFATFTSPDIMDGWDNANGNVSITIYTVSAPEINLKGNSTTILDEDNSPTLNDHTKFGSVTHSSGSIQRIYTMYNDGDAPLSISSVSITGANSGSFSYVLSSSSVAASGSETLQVTFDPDGAGDFNATIEINSNDADEATYNFDVHGWGYASTDLVVSGITNPTTANGTYNHQGVLNDYEYWMHASGSYYIYHNGVEWLIDVDTDKTAALFFSTLNSMNHNPTDASWAVESGTGVPVLSVSSAPDINIQGNSLSITDGDDTPSVDDHTRFGAVNINLESLVRTYTLQNTGTTDLEITAVGLTGTDAALFSLSALVLPSTVAGGSSITVDVTFDPNAEGDHNATLEITSDDPDETTYNFDVNAWGYLRSGITVSGITSPPAANGAYDHVGVINGFQYWKHSTQNYYIYNSGSEWFLDTDTDDATALFFANNHSTEHDPLGVTGWSEEDGTGTPVFTSFEYDNEPPVASCQDTTVYLDNSGNAVITASEINDGSTDNVGITSMLLDVSSFDCSDVGTPVEVTLTVADLAGNSTTCNSQVTVIGITDTTNVFAQTCDPGQVGLTQTTLTNQFGCDSMVIITTTLLPSDTTNITAVTCDPAEVGVRTQVFNNQFGCDSVVIITTAGDVLAPIPPVPPVDLNLACANDVPAPVDLTATDNCGDITVAPTAQIIHGSCLNDFTMIRTWIFADSFGNSSSVSQIITVIDTLAPVLQSPRPADLNLQCASEVPAPVRLTATDNCDGDITVGPTTQIIPGVCLNDFTMVRTWTFSDTCGNTSFVQQTIIVQDNEAPVLQSPRPADLNLQCASEVPAPVRLTATDNCDGDITVGPTEQITPGDNVNDFTMVRTWTFVDACGNVSNVSQTITVKDDLAPVINCSSDIIADNDPGICGALINYQITSDDNCSVESVVQTTGLESGSEFPVGITTNTFVVTDASGNTATCSFDVTVVDVTLPVITAIDEPIKLWLPNHKYVSFTLEDLVVDVWDNCSDLQIGDMKITKVTSDEPENGKGDGNTLNDMLITDDCRSVQLRSERVGSKNGRVYTIHLTVDDENGNTGTAVVYVHVSHNKKSIAVDDGPVYTVEGNCTEAGSGNKSGVIVDTPLEIGVFDVTMYPNPSKGEVNLTISSSEIQEAEVVVRSIIGSEVFRKEYKASEQVKIDLSDQVSGVYLITLQHGNHSVIKKLILDRK